MEDLLEWAESCFQEAVPVGGSSMGQGAHLRQAQRHKAKRQGKSAEEVQPPDPTEGLPAAAQDAWRAFCLLHQQRATSMSDDPAPLSIADIEAFGRLPGERLTPWLVDAIINLDVLFREQVTSGGSGNNRNSGSR